MKVKINSIYREILLYIILLDIIINYVGLQINATKLVVGFHWCIFLLTLSIRVFFDYLLLFYLWSNVRIEDYSTEYQSSGILSWTFIFAIEYILNLIYVFLPNLNKRTVYLSFIVIIYLFVCIRYKDYYSKKMSMGGYERQFEEDRKILIPLIALAEIPLLGYLLIGNYFDRWNIYFVCSLQLLVIVLFLYVFRSTKYLLKLKISKRKIFKITILLIAINLISVLGFPQQTIIEFGDINNTIFKVILSASLLLFEIVLLFVLGSDSEKSVH